MNSPSSLPPLITALLQRGVIMPAPHRVQVDDSVMPERIAAGVTLHPGVWLRGNGTSIGPGSLIGAEGPAVLEDCQLGHRVELGGGYFSGAVFLDGAKMGGGAHVRPGTILSEESNGAHTVGLKQTVLLPFVTLGSLINFCDVLMAGGTSRKNHGEVGSSYIHFNYTPHGDKATASLIGDVPRGVMVDQPPIFLGGQGGLVGPSRIEYGVIIAAGTIQRKDALKPNHLYAVAPVHESEPRPYVMNRYRLIDRIVRNNLIYIGNIRALTVWYRRVRYRMMHSDPYREACRLGALQQLEVILKERIKRLQELAEKMPESIRLLEADPEVSQRERCLAQQRKWVADWPNIKESLKQAVSPEPFTDEGHRFMEAWNQQDQQVYIESLKALAPEIKKAGTAWLQSIVDQTAACWTSVD